VAAGSNCTVIVPVSPAAIGKPVSAPATTVKSAVWVPVMVVERLAKARGASPVLVMVRTLVAVEPAPVMFQRTVPNVRSPPTES
jgi:glyoxylate carboligase